MNQNPAISQSTSVAGGALAAGLLVGKECNDYFFDRNCDLNFKIHPSTFVTTG